MLARNVPEATRTKAFCHLSSLARAERGALHHPEALACLHASLEGWPLARTRLWPSFETRASTLLRTRLIDAAI